MINIQDCFLVAFNDIDCRSAAQSGDLEKNVETAHAFLKVAKFENKRKFERYELRVMPMFATVSEHKL